MYFNNIPKIKESHLVFLLYSCSSHCINTEQVFPFPILEPFSAEIVYRFKVWHIVAWICQGWILRDEAARKEERRHRKDFSEGVILKTMLRRLNSRHAWLSNLLQNDKHSAASKNKTSNMYNISSNL